MMLLPIGVGPIQEIFAWYSHYSSEHLKLSSKWQPIMGYCPYGHTKISEI